MFILEKDDNSIPSAANPVYAELDSTPTDPIPSNWIKLRVSLPAGYECRFSSGGLTGGASIRFEGTYANNWDISDTTPVVDQPKKSEIRVEVINGEKKEFWIRTNTAYNETPIDDRSVALKIDGETRKV